MIVTAFTSCSHSAFTRSIAMSSATHHERAAPQSWEHEARTAPLAGPHAGTGPRRAEAGRVLWLSACLVLSVLFLVGQSYNPFIYFQF